MPAFSEMVLTEQTLEVESGTKVATGQSIEEHTDGTRDKTVKNPITVKHLLTMTAGLDYNLYAPGIRTAKEAETTTTQELAEAMDLGYVPI